MMASETFTELDDALSQLKAELDQKCKADPRPDKQTRYLFEKGWLLVNGEYESLKEKKALWTIIILQKLKLWQQAISFYALTSFHSTNVNTLGGAIKFGNY